MSSREPATTPATTSLWPPRYFDAECSTRSTPCSSGRWKIGEAQLLSMTVTTPCERASGGEARQVLRPEDPAGRALQIEQARARQRAGDGLGIAAVDELDAMPRRGSSRRMSR